MTIDYEAMRGVLQNYIKMLTETGGLYDNHTDKEISKARLLMNDINDLIPNRWYQYSYVCHETYCDTAMEITVSESAMKKTGWSDAHDMR